MSRAYLIALLADGRRPEHVAETLAARTGLTALFRHPRAVLLAGPGCPRLDIAGAGMVVGPLFHRHGPSRRIATLDADECAAILESRGERLLGSFWGGYVALLCGGGLPRVLRDPSGAQPCYFLCADDGLLLASDARLLARASGRRLEIDWSALARHLHANGLPTAETCLAGVRELMPGFALLGDDGAIAPCWSPWDHVGFDSHADAAEGEEPLRRCVETCVRAWTSGYSRLLVSVSGGLDSSLVAACLAGVPQATWCLTLYSDDPRGDERPYARMLCRALGFPLLERRYDVADVDIAAPLNAHLPRPMGRTQALAYERAHIEAAEAHGIDAFVTGHGGDNVFAHSQSASAIADRWLSEGLGAGVIRTLLDTCRQTGCGPLAAVRGALRSVRRRRHGYRWHGSVELLRSDLVAELASTRLDHPWLDAPSDTLPGKRAHVAALLRAQQSLEPMRAARAPVLHPLLSQPLVERCLAIASWHWRAGGIDRAVVRQAFAGRLPPSILSRRVKGGPDGFSAALLHARRVPVRERLLGGRLVAQGIVDGDALAAALAEGHSAGRATVRLQELLVAEAWIDHWGAA